MNRKVYDGRYRDVSASEFKARCLALLDDVATTGNPLVVTKRGTPVAKVVPFEGPPSLIGSVRYWTSEKELLAPVGESWTAAES